MSVLERKYHFGWVNGKNMSILCKNRGLDDKGTKEEKVNRIMEYEENNNYKNKLNYQEFAVKSLKPELLFFGLNAKGSKEDLLNRLTNNNVKCYEDEKMNEYCKNVNESLIELKNSLNKFNNYLENDYIDNKEKQNKHFKNNRKITQTYRQTNYNNNNNNSDETDKQLKLIKKHDYMSQTEWKEFDDTVETVKKEIQGMKATIGDYIDVEQDDDDILNNNNNNNDDDEMELDNIYESNNNNNNNNNNSNTLYIVYNDKSNLVLKQDEAVVVGAFRNEERAEDVMQLNKHYALVEKVLE